MLMFCRLLYPARRPRRLSVGFANLGPAVVEADLPTFNPQFKNGHDERAGFTPTGHAFALPRLGDIVAPPPICRTAAKTGL